MFWTWVSLVDYLDGLHAESNSVKQLNSEMFWTWVSLVDYLDGLHAESNSVKQLNSEMNLQNYQIVEISQNGVRTCW